MRLAANERAGCYPGINVPLSDRVRVRIKCGECVLSGPESDKIGIFKFPSDNLCQPSQPLHKQVSAVVTNKRLRENTYVKLKRILKCLPSLNDYFSRKLILLVVEKKNILF